MADYNEQFLEACKGGQIEEAKRLVHYHSVDVHEKDELAFRWACKNGHIKIAKWLVHDHQVNVHTHDKYEDAFRWACCNGYTEIAKWLVQDHQVDVHVCDEDAFKMACENGHEEIINWFIDEYRCSQSPYYYHNQTGYILNHEPLKNWLSCTILGCSIVYRGKLDEPAVIAYMATLKKPKSARS